jgi:hypothetical protein
MPDGPTLPVIDSGPLAVCVYDCDLDFGQSGEDLSKLCFRVHCAFAEMRWGSVGEKAPTPDAFIQRRCRWA